MIVILCVMLNIIFLLNATIAKNEYFEILGISIFCMNNNLMEDDINKNDLIVVKQVSEKELQEGDIIAYRINGNIRINKIINKQKVYTTKSNKNYQPDIEKITNEQIIGKKVANIKFLGLILKVLQSRVTSVIILIFLLLKFSYNKYIYTTQKERTVKKRRFKE